MRKRKQKKVELFDEILHGGKPVKACTAPIVGVSFDCEFGNFIGRKRNGIIKSWLDKRSLVATSDSMYKIVNLREKEVDEILDKENRHTYKLSEIKYISGTWNRIIEIEHRPDNSHDSNAQLVKVMDSHWSEFSDIGYLPRDLSNAIAENCFEIFLLEVLATKMGALRLGLMFLDSGFSVSPFEVRKKEKVEYDIKELDRVLSI